MTLTDARKITQLLNAIGVETGMIPARDKTELRSTVRTLRLHVSQLRQILDLGALVEQDRATARILNKLETVIPDAQAAVALKLGRAELRKRGMALPEEGPRPSRRMA